MLRKHVERIFWAAAISIAAWTTVWASNRYDATARLEDAAIPHVSEQMTSFDFDSLLASGAIVVQRNPFRLDRRSAGVSFQNRDALQVTAEVPQDQTPPSLSLIGIVGGAQAQLSALVDGIPGYAGSRLLQEGERFGDVLILSITRDSVTVQWADTTWSIRLKKPW